MISKGALFELAKALDGIPILGCLPGTPAALAGVRYGDILLAVNGRRTHGLGDYLEAKALRDDGMTVLVFRAGEERPVELVYHANRTNPDPLSILAELISMNALPEDLAKNGASS